MSRGGKRTGAGRPRKPDGTLKIARCYRLHKWLVAWMAEQPGTGTSIIERAVINQHGLTAPDGDKGD